MVRIDMLTHETAAEYVETYFAKLGVVFVLGITFEQGIGTDEHRVDVEGTTAEGEVCFSVWLEQYPNGSQILYGEY